MSLCLKDSPKGEFLSKISGTFTVFLKLYSLPGKIFFSVKVHQSTESVHVTQSDSSRACTVFIYGVLARLPDACVSDVSGFTSQAGQVDLEF